MGGLYWAHTPSPRPDALRFPVGVVRGNEMGIVVGVALAAAAAWVAAPWIAMARHGTVDQRTVASWWAEYAIPAPRRAPDDVPVRDRIA